MLGGAAVALMRDVFGRPDLFVRRHAIQKRVVAWGPGAETVKLPHSAVVVSESELLEAVGSEAVKVHQTADWLVVASRPLPEACVEHCFGSRLARAVPVAIKGDADTCWIESFEEGWLFLIPNSARGGWLLAVGADAKTLLEQSRLIGPFVGDLQGQGTSFPAYPRIAEPLQGKNWLACGSAAMAFDPICGDGTANAVREAILAAAVIRAGSDALPHFEARLTAGFQRHLALCTSYYQTGHKSEWWRAEAEALQKGLDWCAAKSAGHGNYQYRLQDFDLVPVLP
jgi:hypothetical protein